MIAHLRAHRGAIENESGRPVDCTPAGMSTMGRERWRWLLLLSIVVFVASCAPGANPHVHEAAAGGEPAGFWLGLWHGIVVWITFFVSLFNHGVSVYEVHNSGWPYNLGFVIGAACFHGGGASASRRRRKKQHAER